MADSSVDFFVSHAGPDRDWAVWIDAQLVNAGFATITDVYDFKPGQNFVLLMSNAVKRSAKVLLVSTPRAVDRWMVDLEWTAAIAGAPDRVVPVIVEPCELPEILRPILHIDLTRHAGDGASAAAELIGRLRGSDRPGPGAYVPFPGTAPGRDIEIGFPLRDSLLFSPLVPPRDLYFTGRSAQLRRLEAGLAEGGDTAVTYAVEGLGGVGKSGSARRRGEG